ncbi:Fe-S cluster assembly protein HesB [Ectobacillus sp. JY-23]|uniref:iron-sulfur cluster biosynthesis family protein n=1 Tax=Ectobacillus sp. JY-23 TaxID=2933872 RepID=UPI001FF541CE|nr:iron-sulfur cluster biosynthesis family protein [Ectobacillus sp. JY-23]UOY93047.1 Fe-S cluster assembly protein HesB [Ectobacillus sp. JY-23]
MDVKITEKAKAAFHALRDTAIVRVHITPGGGCSAIVNLDLVWDELVPEEVVYEENLLYIQMNTYAKEYIGDTLIIDYGTGFRLYTPNETLGYGLSVQKVKPVPNEYC